VVGREGYYGGGERSHDGSRSPGLLHEARLVLTVEERGTDHTWGESLGADPHGPGRWCRATLVGPNPSPNLAGV